MSKTLGILAAVAASCAVASTPAIAEDHAMTKGEEKLAKLLEGRVAGEPVSCIRTFPTVDLDIIDGTALVYKRGRTLWVNIPRNADDLDDRDALVTRQFSSRLCRTNIVTTIDSQNGIYTGNVFLGDFVPYTLAES